MFHRGFRTDYCCIILDVFDGFDVFIRTWRAALANSRLPVKPPSPSSYLAIISISNHLAPYLAIRLPI
jgi:hypothetical protein